MKKNKKSTKKTGTKAYKPKKTAKSSSKTTEKASKKQAASYKVRLNEKLTTAQVNKVLDAIDANNGYCPCQPKGKGTKCHCDDFKKNKKTGEPCICSIYVKQDK